MNEQLPVQLSFDISLPERAQRIRDLVGVARTCIIEIGRELTAAKAQIGHGGWLPWLEEEFGWSERTAQLYMRATKTFGKYESLSHFEGNFTNEAFYALSAPDVPQQVRDEAVALAEDGEHVTKADAEALIAEAIQAERAKFEALVAQLQTEDTAQRYMRVARAFQIPYNAAFDGVTIGRRRQRGGEPYALKRVLGSPWLTSRMAASSLNPTAPVTAASASRNTIPLLAPLAKPISDYLVPPSDQNR